MDYKPANNTMFMDNQLVTQCGSIILFHHYMASVYACVHDKQPEISVDDSRPVASAGTSIDKK
jgi:hypothetical protein